MADFTSLKENIRGRIVLPSDGNKYDNEIKRIWNACLHDKRPLAFVKVEGKSDVGKTIKFCVDSQLEICVCCGCTSDFAIADDAVVIDLSMMNRIKVDKMDKMNKTAVIEGGALVSDVDKALHEYGLVLPMGSFSKLGVAGMTLMGGLGFLTRSYGMTSDNVSEYELVNDAGDVVKVSDEQNEDLFWGMKGTGFNFGIVTSMRLKVFEMPNLIVGGIMYYPMSHAKEVIQAIRDYHDKANDNKLSLYMLLHVKLAGPELLVRLHYNGDIQAGEEIVQDLQDLTHPYRNTCGPVAHCDFQRQGDYLHKSGVFNEGSVGHFLTELKDEVIDNLIDGITKVPNSDFKSYSGSIIYITTVGGKANEIDLESSSFPFRGNSSYWIGMIGSTNKEDNLDALKDWVAGIQAINAKYGLAPYGGNGEKAEEKLKQLKQQYDPDNIFHNNCMNINPK